MAEDIGLKQVFAMLASLATGIVGAQQSSNLRKEENARARIRNRSADERYNADIEQDKVNAEMSKLINTFEGEKFPEFYKDVIGGDLFSMLQSMILGRDPNSNINTIMAKESEIRTLQNDIKNNVDNKMTLEQTNNAISKLEDDIAQLNEENRLPAREQLVQGLTDLEKKAGVNINKRLDEGSNMKPLFNTLTSRLENITAPQTGSNLDGAVNNINKIGNATGSSASRDPIETLTGGRIAKASEALAKLGLGNAKSDVSFIGDGGNLFEQLRRTQTEEFDRSSEQQLASLSKRQGFTGELDTSFGQSNRQTLENNIKRSRDSLVARIALDRFLSEKGIKESALERDIKRGSLTNVASGLDIQRGNVLSDVALRQGQLGVNEKEQAANEVASLSSQLSTILSNMGQQERQFSSDAIQFGGMERGVAESRAREIDPLTNSLKALEKLTGMSNIYSTNPNAYVPNTAQKPITTTPDNTASANAMNSSAETALTSVLQALQLIGQPNVTIKNGEKKTATLQV